MPLMGAERPDLWAAAIANAVLELFQDADEASAVIGFLAGGLASEFEPPRRTGSVECPPDTDTYDV